MQSGQDIDPLVESASDAGREVPGHHRRPLNGGWVLMIGAGLLAAVANYTVLTWDEPTTEVVVLTEGAPAGTAVSDLQYAAERVAIDDPGRHQLTGPSHLPSLTGMVTAIRLEAGVMLRRTDLRVPAGTGLGTMSLPVDRTRAVGGLLAAGDRVDVIAALDGPADYVATDLDVIDVVIPGTGVGQPGDGHAVTVAVDSRQAVALARALRAGDIDVVRTAEAGRR